jgi:lipoprotein-releasing system permease protein
MSPTGLILLAFRFLGAGSRRSGRGRSRFVTAVMGIALSVVPLVVVQQVADGMISGIVRRFVETGSYHVQAIARGTPETVPVGEISGVDGVVSARQERQGFGLLYSGSGRNGVTIRAVPEDYWSGDAAIQEYIEVTAGSFDLTAPDSIVLGVHTADRLNARPGDELRLLTVRPLGEGRMLPRVSRLTVSGIVSTGYRDLDRLWVFVPLERGLRIIPDEAARDFIGIKVEKPFALPNPLFNRGLAGLSDGTSRRRMNDTIDEISARAGTGWFVLDWYSLEQGRYISFLTSRNLLSAVMAMIVIVAAINVSSALVLLVVEKEQEIAILRATGISARSIRRAFILAGGAIGIVGATLGTATGLLVAGNINTVLQGIESIVSVAAGRSVDVFNTDFYLEEIPVNIRLLPVMGAVFFTCTVALVAGILPARRAAAVRPDRILRHQ